MHCGQPMPARAAAPAQPTPPAANPAPNLTDAFADQKRKQTMILAISGAVVAILAVLVGLGASGVLAFGAKKPESKILAAKGQAPDPGLLKATGNAPKPSLEKTAEAPKEMPADVEAWLKHLEKCEEMKIAIGGDQAAEVSTWIQKNSVLGAGMGLMNPYEQSQEGEGDQDPGQYTKGKILDLRPRWEELITFFRSYPPPQECQPIASDFDRAINEIPAMMGDLGGILNSAGTDPTAAMQQVKKMQNGSYSDIDRYFARCDEKVSQICAKYNKRKWFNIKQDVGGGGMLGKLGGL
jgi:hypothetical protein